MADHIEPALSAEEWEAPQDVVDGYIDLEVSGVVDVTIDSKRNPRGTRALIALLNHDLPDSDPRKITREAVELLRGIVADTREGEKLGERWGVFDPDAVERLADALEAYLKPE